MLEDKYLQEKLHNTQKPEMQTFSKKTNRTEVRSAIAVYLKEHSKEAMNDCQPKVEKQRGNSVKIPHKKFKRKPGSNVNRTVSVSYAGAVLAERNSIKLASLECEVTSPFSREHQELALLLVSTI